MWNVRWFASTQIPYELIYYHRDYYIINDTTEKTIILGWTVKKHFNRLIMVLQICNQQWCNIIYVFLSVCEFIILPELGDAVPWHKISAALPLKSWSVLQEEDGPADGDDGSCNPKILGPSSLFNSTPSPASFESLKPDVLVSKYGDSNKISGCLLRKFRRGSHWISFSKCLPKKPCGHCRKCCLQQIKNASLLKWVLVLTHYIKLRT